MKGLNIDMFRIRKTLNIVSVALIFVLIVVLLTAILLPILANIVFGSIEHNYYNAIQKSYIHDTEFDYYFNDDNQTDLFEIACNKLPEHVINKIKKDWVVVVSDNSPIVHDVPNAAGMTFYNQKVIWVLAGSDINVYVHEFGHAIDATTGLPSKSTEFKNLYTKYKETYIEYGLNTINDYSVSSDCEYFAAMFVEYCLHSEHLESNAPEMYDFFNNICNNKFVYTEVGSYLAYDLYAIRMIKDMFR